MAGITVGSLVMLGACTQLPKYMRVDSGTDPEHADKKVRFRNTYYYRVFDFCEPHAPAKLSNSTDSGHPVFSPAQKDPVVLNDSLYRFRMTGKADALLSKVHFESGILNAAEIDPFGARVAYDEDSNSFRFVSRQASEQTAARNQRRRELQYMLDLRKQLQAAEVGAAESEQAIRSLVRSLGPQPGADSAGGGSGSSQLALKTALEQTGTAIEQSGVAATSASNALEAGGEAVGEAAKVLPPFQKTIAGALDALKQSVQGSSVKASNHAKERMETGKILEDAVKKEVSTALKSAESAQQQGQVSLEQVKLAVAIATNAVKDLETKKAELLKLKGESDNQQKTNEQRKKDAEAALARIDQALKKIGSSLDSLKDDMIEKRKNIALIEQKPNTEPNKNQELETANRELGQLSKFAIDVLEQRTDLDSVEAAIELKDIESRIGKAKTALKNAETEKQNVENVLKEIAGAIKEVEKAQKNLFAIAGAGPSKSGSGACPPGFDQRRGYQIMGPEGWRTFNQDERLVMAMSTSDKPLINTLQELSGRILNQQVSRGDRLLPFAEARIAVLRARRSIDNTTTDDTEKLIDDVISALKEEGVRP